MMEDDVGPDQLTPKSEEGQDHLSRTVNGKAGATSFKLTLTLTTTSSKPGPQSPSAQPSHRESAVSLWSCSDALHHGDSC